MKYSITLLFLLSAALASAQSGSIDTTFGNHPWVLTDFSHRDDAINSLAILPDGKFIAVGSSSVTSDSKISVARFLANGSLDSSFANDGKILLHSDAQLEFGHSILLQPDGKFIVGGLRFDVGFLRFIM